MYKELEDFLDRFRNKENEYNEDSYERTLYIPVEGEDNLDDEVDFYDELEKVMEKIGITQYEMTNCGGFDSPGYDITCYCISYIDLEGRLQTIPVNFEIY